MCEHDLRHCPVCDSVRCTKCDTVWNKSSVGQSTVHLPKSIRKEDMDTYIVAVDWAESKDRSVAVLYSSFDDSYTLIPLDDEKRYIG